MRRCYRDTEFIQDDEGNIIGINLGWDFTSQHEWGIKGLQSDFGLNLEKEIGFEARKNSMIPSGFVFYENIYPEKDTIAMLYDKWINQKENRIDYLLDGELALFEDDDFVGAWDQGSFGLHTIIENKNIVKELYDAFQNKNGVIMLGGRFFIGNSGLLLLDYAKIPDSIKNEFRNNDKKYRNEQAMYKKLEKKSGVYELLKKSGKDFIYLKIRRLDDNGQPLWWLNPLEQSKYEIGWYTTEDLKLWAKDKGPVIKQKE